MKVIATAVKQKDGTFNVYLANPAEPGTALWHLTGCTNPLSDRDVRELSWAADRIWMKPRDVLAAVRSTLRGR
jgi:hypothetical protein